MLQGMIKNLVPLFSDQDLLPDSEPKKKAKTFQNCLADTFNEVIFERKIPLSRVQKDTNIPFPTLDDWIKGRSTPLADDNLMNLAKYLDLSLEYLCFGIGSEESIETRVNRIAKHFNVEPETIFKIMDGEIMESEDHAS